MQRAIIFLCTVALGLALLPGLARAGGETGSPQLGRRLYQLGETRSTDSVEMLIDHLRHPDKHIRRIAAHALGKIGDRQALVPLLRLALDHNQPRMVRCCAVGALCRLKDSRAVQALAGLAQNASRPLRKAARKALSRMTEINLSYAR